MNDHTSTLMTPQTPLSTLIHKVICALLLLLLMMVFFALPKSQAQNVGRLSLMINEGGKNSSSVKEIADRYKGVAADLSRLLAKPIDIEVVQNYPAVIAGLKVQKYDIAYVHAGNIAMTALKKDGYHLSAATVGYDAFRVSIFVNQNSPLQSLVDLKKTLSTDKLLIAPIAHSDAAVIGSIMVKRAIGAESQVNYIAYEDDVPSVREDGISDLEALPFLIAKGLGAMGASSSNIILDDWKSKGGRVIAQSPVFPSKLMLTNKRLSAADRNKISLYFLNLSKSDIGKSTLQKIGFRGFIAADETDLIERARWFDF